MPSTARSAWWLVLATGLAGLLVGFAVGATFSRPGDAGATSLTSHEAGTTSLPSHEADATPTPGVAICDTPRANAPGRDENGCWFPGNYFEAPPEVIPEVGVAAPLIRLLASGAQPMGIEGTLFFIRVLSPIDEVILARPWTWPGMEQLVPPGAYQVTIYARSCDGNCELLDPTDHSCTVDLLAEPAETYTIRYEIDNLGSPICGLAS